MAESDAGNTAVMMLKSKLIAIALVPGMAASCHQAPPLCFGSPPEDSRDYEKWKAQQNVNCPRPTKTDVR